MLSPVPPESLGRNVDVVKLGYSFRPDLTNPNLDTTSVDSDTEIEALLPNLKDVDEVLNDFEISWSLGELERQRWLRDHSGPEHLDQVIAHWRRLVAKDATQLEYWDRLIDAYQLQFNKLGVGSLPGSREGNYFSIF